MVGFVDSNGKYASVCVLCGIIPKDVAGRENIPFCRGTEKASALDRAIAAVVTVKNILMVATSDGKECVAILFLPLGWRRVGGKNETST